MATNAIEPPLETLDAMRHLPWAPQWRANYPDTVSAFADRCDSQVSKGLESVCYRLNR